MSWDVVVFNCHGNPPAHTNDFPEDHVPDPLGTAEEVREAISRVLPNVDWSDPEVGVYFDADLSLEFNVREEPTVHLMIHVRGSGDALGVLVRLAMPNQWSLVDCSTGKFLDLANPSPESWQGFQDFRDSLLEEP